MLKNLLLIGLGGGIGSMVRYITWYLFRSPNFPIPTLLVNIAGSLAIGIVIGLSIKHAGFSNNWKLFLATGICGGFTTFSAFSAEVLVLLRDGNLASALLYISLSVVVGVSAVFLAMWIVKTV